MLQVPQHGVDEMPLLPSGRPHPTERDFALLLSLLGHDLPPAYRSFLQEVNGATPSPGWFKYVHWAGVLWLQVEVLYGLGPGGGDSVEQAFFTYEGRIPDNCLAVGGDGWGNLFVLFVRGEQRGAVGYWVHDEERPVEVISQGFAEFLEALGERGE